ncbi:hypothetical protein ACRE_077320 [Hapsidospora chrysogenum ATCC 11550]|uniref:Uncharacterized protein n=1 Tax=Hapsidospora chrysogenum (strain ATCC 11550 / CBS 779.69 / DSM 880 / IAM 14645 / JCM 23072 / IMI 49137) TaxID=857340 RepID=A0A086SWR1_HAPC1|nr:hypothetical protein ACRE_077320 [Hapsidospora chrysogenum ATCC 11550]
MSAPISSQSFTRGSASSTSAATSTMQHQSPAAASIPAAPAPAQVKTPSTDPFLKDFTLLAEAAKRAQVAVLVRDFEDCGIS